MSKMVLWTFGALVLMILLPTVEASAQEKTQTGHESVLGPKKESPVVEEGIVLWDKNELKISLAGLLEAEIEYVYFYGRHSTGYGAADAVTADWHIDLDISYKNNWEGHATILWEEDDTEPVDMDEGWLRYINRGFFIGGGKTYLPFGKFDTFFVSDPFTLEIGEMRESGVFLGYESDLFGLSGMIANGDTAKVNKSEERIELWAFSLDLNPAEGIESRICCVSNIAEGDGFLAGALALYPFYNRQVGGFQASLHLTAGSIEFVGEVVMPFEPFARDDLDADGNGHGDRPRAANFEAAYNVGNDKTGEWCFATRLEITRHLEGVPVRRAGFAVSYNPLEKVGITLECLHYAFDKRFSPSTSHGYSVTLQMSLSF